MLDGIFYFGIVARISTAIGHLVRPIFPLVGVNTAILVAVAITGHIVAALISPKDANTTLDERELRERQGDVTQAQLGVEGRRER